LSSAAKQSNDRLVPESRKPIDVAGVSLAELQKLLKERRLPPVDQWNPQRCGHSSMRIARDGTWYHDGEPIRRLAMVRLFSTVLRREPDGTHVLVTPAEKLAFGLDSGDAVVLGPDHPLSIVETDQGPSPRLTVRHGLEAELTRSIYYELAELAIASGEDPPGVWSSGVYFPFGAEQ
jgi:hypothetical protein